jgi:hypothetical protein
MKSWRTTLSGAVSSGAGLVLALSTAGVAMPRWVVVAAGFIMAGGFASLGIVAKDSTTHSTLAEVQQSTVDETKQAIAHEQPIAAPPAAPVPPGSV